MDILSNVVLFKIFCIASHIFFLIIIHSFLSFIIIRKLHGDGDRCASKERLSFVCSHWYSKQQVTRNIRGLHYAFQQTIPCLKLRNFRGEYLQNTKQDAIVLLHTLLLWVSTIFLKMTKKKSFLYCRSLQLEEMNENHHNMFISHSF